MKFEPLFFDPRMDIFETTSRYVLQAAERHAAKQEERIKTLIRALPMAAACSCWHLLYLETP